jgi:carbamoyltransferase
MPITLGISAFYHDAAAAVVRDGQIIAAASEERFTRRKADPTFPTSAITYCLEEANITAKELDSVAYYDNPALTFDRLLATSVAAAPKGFATLKNAMPRWVSEKLHIPAIIQEHLEYPGPILLMQHHLSHAAAAYLPSPFEKAAILTLDGVGEWATSSLGVGEGAEVRLLHETRFPHSLGLLYSSITAFCGFKVNTGEYKLMGLAPYGTARYLSLIKNHLAELAEDGSLSLNMDYFAFLSEMRMYSTKFEELFGGPAREQESQITRREMDLAASVQAFTEETVLKMAAHTKKITGMSHLCLAGGVALNCVANGHLLRSGLFEDIWIQPAAGDAGSSLGAALAAQHGWHKVPRQQRIKNHDSQHGSYLGPAFSEAEVGAFLIANGHKASLLPLDQRALTVASALAEGKIVGYFQGRMEFGPRSLGGRSILGDPRRTDTQRVMNLSIKYRESFRPFAPAVLAEDAAEYFELDRPSPYMLLVAPVRQDRRTQRSAGFPDSEDLLEAVNQVRSDIPSVTHWDYSARVQTVHRDTNPEFHSVLTAFKRLTGFSVLVNTSFNVRGEPIVCTPEDAFRCFLRTEMDYLYLEGYWIDKNDFEKDESGAWKNEFALD